jgi:hypothetical protein
MKRMRRTKSYWSYCWKMRSSTNSNCLSCYYWMTMNWNCYLMKKKRMTKKMMNCLSSN